MSHQRILIDGSKGEGGGQIIRNAIAYAALCHLDLEIQNVRANRPKPGLQKQHLLGLRTVANLCGGTLAGDELHSSRITFAPNSRPPSNHITADTETAGSIMLMLQASLPYCFFSKDECHLTLKGGTNATMAPQYDYFTKVFLPIAQPGFGLPNVHAKLIRRGFFPRGGGEVQIAVSPNIKTISPITMVDRGDICSIAIHAFSAGKLPPHLAEKMAKSARTRLAHICHIIHVSTFHETEAVGSCLWILLVAETSTGCKLAGSAIGSPRQKADDTGRAAADELLRNIDQGGCVDEYLQDQLILYMALAEGVSQVRTGELTLHTTTAMSVAEQMTAAKFEVQKLSGSQNLIRCHGIGFRQYRT